MLVALLLCCVCGCRSSAPRAKVLHVQVRGSAQNLSVTEGCFLLLRSKVVGGGWMTYCLERFGNASGPNATVVDAGRMTFALPSRTIRARVHITAKFASDGVHAMQTMRGTVTGGGTITGGGPYVEQPPGHVRRSDLRYTIRLTS